MPIEVVIIITIVLQALAAILALRLITITRRRSAWLLLSSAMSFWLSTILLLSIFSHTLPGPES